MPTGVVLQRGSFVSFRFEPAWAIESRTDPVWGESDVFVESVGRLAASWQSADTFDQSAHGLPPPLLLRVRRLKATLCSVLPTLTGVRSLISPGAPGDASWHTIAAVAAFRALPTQPPAIQRDVPRGVRDRLPAVNTSQLWLVHVYYAAPIRHA